MLVVITSVSSGYKLTLLNNLHNVDNDFRKGDSTPLFINVFGKSFYFIHEIFDKISHFLEGEIRINILINIVARLS